MWIGVGIVAVILAAFGLRRAVGSGDGDGSDRAGRARSGEGDDGGSRLAARAENKPIDAGRALLIAEKASISGRVRDADGQPIAGATVCADARSRELFGAGDDEARCSPTERDGHYRIEDVWPVTNTVHASAPGFRPSRWTERADGRERDEVRVHDGQDVRGIDITLEPGGVAVRGVVKDISGGVIDGAVVRGSAGRWFLGDERAMARTDDEGRFELWLPPGPTRLEARAEGYATADTRSHAPTEIAELFLTPESAISGVVVLADSGEPAPGVTVSADTAGFFAAGGSGSAITGDDGRFRIAGLEPGSYDIGVRADELYGEAAEQVHLGLGQSAEQVVVTAHPAFAVRGKVVVAETGSACTQGSVTLDLDGLTVRGSTDEHGAVLLRGVLPGTYEVEVACADYHAEPEYADLVVEDASLDGLEWSVHTGLAIRGDVVDSKGTPVPDVRVRVRAKGDADDPRGQRTSSWGVNTEDDGRFEARGLLPGTYELEIWAQDYPGMEEPESVELGEAADVEGVRLVLSGSGSLRGSVRDEHGAAMPGVMVRATGLGERWRGQTTHTGDDGSFTFERLGVGEVRVQAQIDWSQQLRAPGTSDDDLQGELVAIVDGGEARVDLVIESQDGQIRGRVVDSTGAPVGDAFVDATRLSDSAAANASTQRWAVRWGWDRQPVLSEPDGSFAIAGLADGDYMVRAYREGGGEAIVEDVAVGSSNVVLTVVDTGVIAGTVRLAGGGNPERFSISLLERSQVLMRNDDFFRTKGGFAMRELPPGTYEVTATSPEGTAKAEVTLATGQAVEDVDIELVPKVTIEGRLVDSSSRKPVSGMRVRVFAEGAMMMFGADDDGGEEISDADGRFRVEDADAGKVRVWIAPRNWDDDTGYGWTNRVMNLPSEPPVQDIGEIELLASRVARDERPGDLGYKLLEMSPEIDPEERWFEVAVVRPGGPADGSGLAVGDRIVAVDGQSVVGLDNHRYSTLTRAPPGTTIELTIARAEGGGDDGEGEGGQGNTVSITLGAPVQ